MPKVDGEMIIDDTVDLIMKRGGYTVVVAGDKYLKARYRDNATGEIKFSTDRHRYVFKPDAQGDENFLLSTTQIYICKVPVSFLLI